MMAFMLLLTIHMSSDLTCMDQSVSMFRSISTVLLAILLIVIIQMPNQTSYALGDVGDAATSCIDELSPFVRYRTEVTR